MEKSKQQKKDKKQNENLVEFVIDNDLQKSVYCKFITETENAICVKTLTQGLIIWLPFSQLKDDSPNNDEYVFIIPEWLAMRSELIP